MNSKTPIILALIAATAAPASAATGPWVDVAPSAKIRVLTADAVENGKMMAALEFQLRDGMKTYWRVPGESGIPLTADWAKSENVEMVEFLWPMPKRAVTNGYFDYVYDDDFVLPFEIHLPEQADGELPHLVGNLLMGICGEICVPVTFQVDQYLDVAKKDIAVSFKIEAAKANVPIVDDRENAPFPAVYLDKAQNQFVVQPSADGRENHSLILDLPQQNLLFDVPQNGPGSPLITIKALKDVPLDAFVGSTARLTYSGEQGAFEQLVPILSIEALAQ